MFSNDRTKKSGDDASVMRRLYYFLARFFNLSLAESCGEVTSGSVHPVGRSWGQQMGSTAGSFAQFSNLPVMTVW